MFIGLILDVDSSATGREHRENKIICLRRGHFIRSTVCTVQVVGPLH
jgi:hypothetical protein